MLPLIPFLCISLFIAVFTRVLLYHPWFLPLFFVFVKARCDLLSEKSATQIQAANPAGWFLIPSEGGMDGSAYGGLADPGAARARLYSSGTD